MAEQDIELVLPEGEVDIHEADVIQEKLEDQDFSAASSEEVAETPAEELDDYSEKVKKRIDKLTYQMREAERQRDEAVDYAQKIQDQNGSLQQK